MRRFLVLHGWQNHRPRQHWQWQLVEALRSDGEQVLYPQLPDPDRPSLDLWIEVLRAELAQLGDGERVVLAHSCPSCCGCRPRRCCPDRNGSTGCC